MIADPDGRPIAEQASFVIWFVRRLSGDSLDMGTLLFLIAAILVIAGIYVIVARRDILWGAVLIVLGLLVGPGGVSIFG